MRRYMRKPKDMTTREYIARVNEINGYLNYFPPYNEDQGLATDELLDLLEFAVPNTWQKQFWLQGFDPIEHSVTEFTQFCERLEFTETLHAETHAVKKRPRANQDLKGRNSNSKQRIADNAQSGGKSNKWCEYHQTSTHNTGECKVLLAQARKMRGAWNNRSERGNNQARAESNNDEQLNTMVSKAVNKALKSAKKKS